MTELATPPVEREQDVKRISHWIGGQIVEGKSGRSGPVFNPALGQQTGAVDFATAEEVDLAVQTAKDAFESWRAMSLSKRTAIFFQIRELVHDRQEEIARFSTAEHGKVLSDAMGEVARGLEVIEDRCGIPELLKGEFSEQASTGIDVYRSASRSAWSRGSPRSTSRRWSRCGCGRPHWPAATRSCSSRRSSYLSCRLRYARTAEGGRCSRTGVFNVVHGDKVAVDSVHRAPVTSQAVSFVGSTPIAHV